MLIEAKPEGPLIIGATDSVLGVVCEIDGMVSAPGQAVLQHRRLSAIVNELPPGMVEVTVDGVTFKTTIKSKEAKRKAQMSGIDPQDYPPLLKLSAMTGDELFRIESKILQQVASEVAFAIDPGFVDGVLLAPIDKEKFQFVALSGSAFASALGMFTRPASSQDEVVFPRNLLSATSVLGSDDTEVIVSMDDKKISVTAPGTTLWGGRLVHAFPQVWPQIMGSLPPKKRFRVSSEKFSESVRAVSVAADIVEGMERFIQIDVSYDNGSCVVRTKQSEKGGGEDELTVEEPSEGQCVAHLDGGKLAKALRAFSPTDVDFYFDSFNGQNMLYLKNETLSVMILPLNDIKPKPPADKDKK